MYFLNFDWVGSLNFWYWLETCLTFEELTSTQKSIEYFPFVLLILTLVFEV